MPSMLELPRELYLMVCSYLTPKELTVLAGVSRDHYLAVQQPLYAGIVTKSYSHLIKLVNTLRKVPIVSAISPQQRLRWYKLSDAQLRERDIKHLSILLESSKEGHKITGAILANCIGSVSRNCPNAKIVLTCYGVWRYWVKQLAIVGMPNITELNMFVGSTEAVNESQGTSSSIWDLIFSGSTFSDLKKVYLCTKYHNTDSLPQCMQESIGTAASIYGSHLWKPHQQSSKAQSTPLYALRTLQEITLSHNSYLTVDVMQSLFGSDIIPQRLRKLEIVDCPNLHPVKHLNALSTLLQRALQLVQHLKLQLCKLPNFDDGDTFLDNQYNARIDEHPEEHPCNIVRELGKNVQHLDLALPFACTNIFNAPTRKSQASLAARDYPEIPRESYRALPDRLVEAGYKYRRLIVWHGVCRTASRWNQMIETADEQEGNVSWELLFPPEDSGSWHVAGCSPVRFDAESVLFRP